MFEPPVTFGDVTGEYFALRQAAGLVSGMRRLVWVTGPDAVAFLDGLISQAVGPMTEGAVARSLLLEPRGKLRAAMWVWRGQERVGLLTDSARLDDVVEDLTRYRFRVDAHIAVDERPVLELWGPGSAAVLSAAGLPAPDGWSAEGNAFVGSMPLDGLARYAAVGADRDALVEAGAVPAGLLASTAVRIEGGEPAVGVDVDESTIPQEAGLVEGAVSFTKGCYLGQELVARIDSRGRVNRHLRGIEMAANALPPTGAIVRLREDDVGVLTSVAESLTVRAPIGLAVIRREAEPGQSVEVVWDGGSVAAVVRALPFDDFAVR